MTRTANPSTFAARLRESLARAGVSQADAGRALGVDNRRKVNEIVSGRRPKLEADLDMIRDLADLCGVSPGWLAFGERAEGDEK